MKAWDVVKHVNNTDVAFRITHVTVLDGFSKIRGTWINITNKEKPYDIYPDMIKIQHKDYKNWKLYDI